MQPLRWMSVAALGAATGAAWGQLVPCEEAADRSTPVAQIVALTGQGQTRPRTADDWGAAHLAQRLAAGADVRTLALSSAALLLGDRTQIRMAAQSLLRLCEVQQGQTRLQLNLGRVWARAKEQAVDLQLRTPAAVAAVRGTDWDVQVDGDGRTTLTVLSGRIDVSNALGSVSVGPSEQATALPGQAPTKRTLVNPRERVQWVMASEWVASRWPELEEGGEPWRARALAALREGRMAQLLQEVDARLAVDPQDALAQRLRAELDVQAGEIERAQQRLLAVWRREHDARAAARRAALLLVLDRPDEARAFIAQALERAPQAVPLLLADADASRLQGDRERALALYRQALGAARGPRQEAAAQVGLGRAWLDYGDLAAARQALARAVQLQPTDPEILALAATADARALQDEAAHQGFEAALAQAGDDYVALAGDGLLTLQRGEFERAREQLLKALVIEPRYAQAQVWLAVAEYQLGNVAAAFDALARARQADEKDPLPWQIEAILRNDQGLGEQAVQASREALKRLPWLKSLNPLVSDSLGTANLGRALADFGLEHWARSYAQQSYYPLWAGSHFFMSDHYETNFARASELYQGYLADPLAFGASEKRPGIVRIEGGEWFAGTSAERQRERYATVQDVGHRGLTATPVPMAWSLRASHLSFFPRDDAIGPRVAEPGLNLGLGLKPTDRLGLLLIHTEARSRWWFPKGLEMDGGGRVDSDWRLPFRRTDLGVSWRWSADAQTWFKWASARDGLRYRVDDGEVRSYAYDQAGDHDSLMLRHTQQHGNMRWTFGWEAAGVDLRSSRIYSLLTAAETTHLRYDMPWVSWEMQHGPWSAYVMASWPRLKSDYRYRQMLGSTGEDLSAPLEDAAMHRRRLRPRLGLSYRFAPGRALHAAYIESMYPPAANTLAPLMVEGVAIDYQYQRPGSLARKAAVQLDWELDARSFLYLGAARQQIINPLYQDGSLFADMPVLDGDKVGTLGPLIQSTGTAVDTYNGTPLFDRGQLDQLGVAYNRILTPRWSMMGLYTRARSRNTGAFFEGNALPGVPRHTAAWLNVWRHGGRDFTALAFVYRSKRYTRVSNLTVEDAGWRLSLAHSMDLGDRRWSLMAMLQTPINGGGPTSVWMRLRFRM